MSKARTVNLSDATIFTSLFNKLSYYRVMFRGTESIKISIKDWEICHSRAMQWECSVYGYVKIIYQLLN